MKTDPDTATRMVRDCLSQHAKPGFRALERLEGRIASALAMWSARVKLYGRHTADCALGRDVNPLCDCGLSDALKDAERLEL